MSIILKGIDIPKDIDFVEITTYKNGIPQKTIGKGMDDAIQIDRPHGRLIDGDKLKEDYDNRCCGECDCCKSMTEDYKCGLIENAPTILEAEGR